MPPVKYIYFLIHPLILFCFSLMFSCCNPHQTLRLLTKKILREELCAHGDELTVKSLTVVFRAAMELRVWKVYICSSTFSHLTDSFIQSDAQLRQDTTRSGSRTRVLYSKDHRCRCYSYSKNNQLCGTVLWVGPHQTTQSLLPRILSNFQYHCSGRSQVQPTVHILAHK